jgi:hypothetical protein
MLNELKEYKSKIGLDFFPNSGNRNRLFLAQTADFSKASLCQKPTLGRF